jgi:hypothetical protein
MPKVVYLNKKDFLKKYSNYQKNNIFQKKTCSYFNAREKFFSKFDAKTYETLFVYNDSLKKMSNCFPAPINPFFIDNNTIFIKNNENLSVDIALTLYFIKKNNYKWETAEKLIQASIYSVLWKYSNSGKKSNYEILLKYLFFTNRIPLFVDSAILYQNYKNRMFSQNQLDKWSKFISKFCFQ